MVHKYETQQQSSESAGLCRCGWLQPIIASTCYTVEKATAYRTLCMAVWKYESLGDTFLTATGNLGMPCRVAIGWASSVRISHVVSKTDDPYDFPNFVSRCAHRTTNSAVAATMIRADVVAVAVAASLPWYSCAFRMPGGALLRPRA